MSGKEGLGGEVGTWGQRGFQGPVTVFTMLTGGHVLAVDLGIFCFFCFSLTLPLFFGGLAFFFLSPFTYIQCWPPHFFLLIFRFLRKTKKPPPPPAVAMRSPQQNKNFISGR